MPLPLISIITPTLNRARFLTVALKSMEAQDYPEVEHIIVDAMSTDGTAGLLARHAKLRVIHEPDDGIFDEMNKGLRAATGEVLALLNSDDLYEPAVFGAVMRAFEDPAVEVVTGGADILTEDGRLMQRYSAPGEIELSFANATIGNPIPNARFFRRSILDRVGEFDLRYPIAADRDWLMRMALTNPHSVVLGRIVYRYLWHDGSNTFQDDSVRGAKTREECLVIAEHYLAQPDLPDDARRCCRRWHERESAQAATRALLGGEFGRCRYSAARGVRQNWSWPVMFARHLGGALLGR